MEQAEFVIERLTGVGPQGHRAPTAPCIQKLFFPDAGARISVQLESEGL